MFSTSISGRLAHTYLTDRAYKVNMPVSINLPSGFLLHCDPPSIDDLYRSLRHYLQSECFLVVLEHIHVRCQPKLLGHLTATHLQELRLNPAKYSVHLVTNVSTNVILLVYVSSRRKYSSCLRTTIDFTAVALKMGY